MVGESEIYVLGLLDPDKERARLGKQRDELAKQIRATEGRLANPGFVNKAPAHVVEGARTQLEELKAELGRVEEGLGVLEG